MMFTHSTRRHLQYCTAITRQYTCIGATNFNVVSSASVDLSILEDQAAKDCRQKALNNGFINSGFINPDIIAPGEIPRMEIPYLASIHPT